MPVNVEDALKLLGAANGPAPASISVADDASSLVASIDQLGGVGSLDLTGGTTAPISLDQMLQLERAFDQFPPEVLISVEDTAEKILEFFVSADEDERLSVADADTLTATGGAPISFSGLDTLLAIDDFDAGASNFTVAAAAGEVQDRVSSNLQQLLELPITIDVNDGGKVTLDVAELDGLGVKIVDTSNSVNLVDSVSAITGYGGAVNVNRVTFEAESDGQDLTGIDFASYPGQEAANLSRNGHTDLLISVDQLGTQIVGEGSHDVTGDHGANNGVGSGTIDISNTGSIQYAIQTATGIARDNLDNASSIMITDYQSGDRVEMRVDEYGQYGAKFPAELRDAMTYIIDSPDAISMYNEAGYSPAIPQDDGFGGGGDVSIVVAIVGENGGTATDLTGMDLSGVDRLYPQGNLIDVTVDQASIQMYAPPALGGGSYRVVDTAVAIKADLGSGSSVLDADVLEVMSGHTLELTVSEYNQLTNGQTLVTPYHIVDSAAAIGAEIATDGSDFGVLAGSMSVKSSDGVLSLNVAQAKAINESLSQYVDDYNVADVAAAVEAGVADGDTQAALMRASQVELVGGDDPVAQVDYYLYEMLETAGNIVDTNQFAIHGSASVIDSGTIDFSGPRAVTAVLDGDEDLTGYANLAANATALDLSGFNADLTVDQVNNLQIFEDGGSYDVVDSAGPIEGNIAAIDDADQVFSADVLTLTVAEHEALDDEDTTLEAAYRIKDSAENIMAEIQTQATGSSTVAGGDQAGYDEDLGPSVYDEYDGSVSGNEMEETSSTTLGDVFVIPALPAGSRPYRSRSTHSQPNQTGPCSLMLTVLTRQANRTTTPVSVSGSSPPVIGSLPTTTTTAVWVPLYTAAN